MRKGGCTVHDFEKPTSILGYFGCTGHDIEKLTHAKSEKWMYRSRFREADIHFGKYLDVTVPIWRSLHPFYSKKWCSVHALRKCTSIPRQMYIHPTTSVHPSHDKGTSIPRQRYIHPTTKVHPLHSKHTSTKLQTNPFSTSHFHPCNKKSPAIERRALFVWFNVGRFS